MAPKMMGACDVVATGTSGLALTAGQAVTMTQEAMHRAARHGLLRASCFSAVTQGQRSRGPGHFRTADGVAFVVISTGRTPFKPNFNLLDEASVALARAATPVQVLTLACRYGAFALGAGSAGVWTGAEETSLLHHCPRWPSAGEGVKTQIDPALWPALASECMLGGGLIEQEGDLFVPLADGERVIGCLQLRYPPGAAPQGNDRETVEFFGRIGAAALARTYEHQAEAERRAFLLDAWVAVAEADGYGETLQSLASVAVPRLADLCLIDVKEGQRGFSRMAALHADPAMAPLVTELNDRYSPELGGRHPANTAVEEGRTRWSATMSDEFLRATTRDERHYQLVKLLDFQSYICVPLVADDEVLGAVTLVSGNPKRRFSEADVDLAEELASRVARVVATARHHDREHQFAHELQRLLLPEMLPRTERLETHVRYLTAAAGAEAGGDFYDVVVLPSERVGFMIGDVEGHDAVAAAYMGQLRSAARALAGQVREPSALVDALRWSWELLGFARTATALFGRVDPSSGDVVLSSAGHLPPVLVSSRGDADLVSVPPSPPLGISGEASQDYRLVLDEGSTLFFYTDGLVEYRDGSLEDRLRHLTEFLAAHADAPLEEFCDGALAALAPPGAREDDVAVLALRRLASPEQPS